MNLTELLREGGGHLDATGAILRSMGLQAGAGLAGGSRGIADLLRGKGLQGAAAGAAETVGDVEDRFGGLAEPFSDVGKEKLAGMGRTIKGGVDWARKNVPGAQQAEQGWEKFSMQSPLAAALTAGYVEAGDPTKTLRVEKAAARAAEHAVAKAAGSPGPPTEPAFPKIYDNPKEQVARARVAPEDPSMKRLFGTTRDDLWDIGEHGTRKGNITENPIRTAANPKGSEAARMVMTPWNDERLIDTIAEARKRPELFNPMASWYVMDPVFRRLRELVGEEEAIRRYTKINALTGMASPASEVKHELRRGTAANWLDEQGRFSDFVNYGGVPFEKRAGMADFPRDMMAVPGHLAHKTAHAVPMAKFLRGEGVELDMDSPKVPLYVPASGVPETGFQTRFPVADAHNARFVGLPDYRNQTWNRAKGRYEPNAKSASTPEAAIYGEHFRTNVAEPAGVEAVPGQGVLWGTGAEATGVKSDIGAPKLELLSMEIMRTAHRLGVSPETARDMVLLGKTHAGVADPALLGGLAAGAGGTAAMVAALRQRQQEEEQQGGQ